jgi:hypothetical protein
MRETHIRGKGRERERKREEREKERDIEKERERERDRPDPPSVFPTSSNSNSTLAHAHSKDFGVILDSSFILMVHVQSISMSINILPRRRYIQTKISSDTTWFTNSYQDYPKGPLNIFTASSLGPLRIKSVLYIAARVNF